jgi:membrane-associated phospholipid phosphatase
LRVSEWVALVYFSYLLAVTAIRPPWPRRLRAAATSALWTASVLLISRWPDSAYGQIVRDWIPVAYLVAGYWVSGLFFASPMTAIEARCLAMDRELLGWLGVNRFLERAPRVVLEALELVYFGCFLFVPACVALVIFTDARLADRSWALVLLGQYGAFGMLPWVQTRPPRSLEPPGPFDLRPLTMRRANRFVVRNMSIEVNTLPSGHVAGSLTAAIALWLVIPPAGLVAFAVSACVAFSAVAGRYHYAIDAITGIGVALLAWWVVSGLV